MTTVATTTQAKSKVINKTAVLSLLIDDPNSGRYPAEFRQNLGEFSSIGSVFLRDEEGNITTEISRGLNKIQEKIFLPRDYVTFDVTNNEFNKAAREFWKGYEVNIPKGNSRKLNISYEIKEFEGEKYEHPVNLKDYMDYTFALCNPIVAKTASEAGTTYYKYSLLIEEDLRKQTMETIQLKQKANSLYEEIVSKLGDVSYKPVADRIVDLLQSFSGEIDKTSVDNITIFLYEFKEKKPATFISVVEDKEAETKHLLYKLVEYKILTKDDNTYMFGNKVIGENLNAAIAFMHNDNNQEIPILKAQLANAVSQKIK